MAQESKQKKEDKKKPTLSLKERRTKKQEKRDNKPKSFAPAK